MEKMSRQELIKLNFENELDVDTDEYEDNVSLAKALHCAAKAKHFKVEEEGENEPKTTKSIAYNRGMSRKEARQFIKENGLDIDTDNYDDMECLLDVIEENICSTTLSDLRDGIKDDIDELCCDNEECKTLLVEIYNELKEITGNSNRITIYEIDWKED
jgi:hypothetical protein